MSWSWSAIGKRIVPNFIRIILINVGTEVTSTAKYNSNAARHCSLKFEPQCRKSVYSSLEEDNIVCINSSTARGALFPKVHVIDCIQRHSYLISAVCKLSGARGQAVHLQQEKKDNFYSSLLC